MNKQTYLKKHLIFKQRLHHYIIKQTNKKKTNKQAYTSLSNVMTIKKEQTNKQKPDKKTNKKTNKGLIIVCIDKQTNQ